MNDKVIAGKYKLIRKIGEGGMGIVYEAHETILEQTVALKELSPKHSQDSAYVERFLREAQAMACLRHSSIIRIDTSVKDGDSYYIIMEYFEGENLAQILKTKSLSRKTSLSIALQVAKALSYTHAQKIIHRDIKPGNIMVNSAGTVKIMDFGVAAVTDKSSLTKPGDGPIGTPMYMSPEQARGEVVDYRSDLYSLGMVLYEMLTGKNIYRDLSSDSKEFKLSFQADILPPLQNLVRSLLEKKREKRLLDAETLALHLSNILPKYEAALPPATTVDAVPRSRNGSIKKRLFSGGLFFIFIVILLAAISFYPDLRPEKSSIQKEVLQEEKTETELADQQKKKEAAQKERERQDALAQADQEKREQETARAEQLRLEKQKAEDERERLAEERARVAREVETQAALVAAERKILELEKTKAEQVRLEQEKTQAEQKLFAEKKARTAKEIEKQQALALAELEKLKLEKAKAEQIHIEQEKTRAEQKRLAEEQERAERNKGKQEDLAEAERKKKKQAQKKLASLVSPEADMDFLGNTFSRLKTAYEKKDLVVLQKMSKMSAEKSRFLRQIFQHYQTVQISITEIALTGNTAQALITITGLTSETGNPAFPAFLEDQRKMARITLRKQNGNWSKVIW